jgi:hypothetical protein
MFPDTTYQENFVLGVTGIQVVDTVTDTRGFYLPCANMTNANIANFSAVTTGSFITAAPAVGQRVLVNGQSTTAENGIYLITGTSGADWVMSRASDLNASAEIKAFAYVFVENGSISSKYWLDLPVGPYTLGTTGLSFKEAPDQFVTYTVQAASTTVITPLVGGAPDVIDGVTLLSNDVPVLLAGQTAWSENTIVSVNNPPATPVLIRDVAFLIEPAEVTTLFGATLGVNQLWETYYDPAATVIDTDPVEWIKTSSRLSFSSVATSSTGNVDLTVAAPATIDDISLAINMRILLKNQTDKKENGIYIVTPQRTLRLVRASDMNDTADMVPNARTHVLQGVLWSNSHWGIYLDNMSPVMGTNAIRWVKQPPFIRLSEVRLATTANIASLSSGAPKTLDGVAVKKNDRILVKNQTTQSQNGIYIVVTVGTGSSGKWARASDLESSEQLVPQLSVYVKEGTVNASSDFLISLPTPADTIPAYTLGSTNIQWGTQSALTLFGQSPDTWTPVPFDINTSALLGAAGLQTNNESYGVKIAVAVQPPVGEPDGEVRRLRLMAQYDTVDE